jgi:hypothetical protein
MDDCVAGIAHCIDHVAAKLATLKLTDEWIEVELVNVLFLWGANVTVLDQLRAWARRLHVRYIDLHYEVAFNRLLANAHAMMRNGIDSEERTQLCMFERTEDFADTLPSKDVAWDQPDTDATSSDETGHDEREYTAAQFAVAAVAAAPPTAPDAAPRSAEQTPGVTGDEDDEWSAVALAGYAANGTWRHATSYAVMHWLWTWDLSQRTAIVTAMRACIDGKYELATDRQYLSERTEEYVYFVTHLILIQTEYGTRSLPASARDEELNALLVSYFDFARATQSAEATLELAACLLLVTFDEHPLYPPLVAFIDETRDNVSARRLPDSETEQDWDEDNHTHFLTAHLLALYLKHEFYLAWNNQDPLTSLPAERACGRVGPGYVILDHRDMCIQDAVCPPVSESVLVRITDDTVHSIEGPPIGDEPTRARLCALRKAVLCGPVARNITEHFGRVTFLPDEMYFRAKTRGGSTPPHADYYYLRDHADLSSTAQAIDDSALCVDCQEDSGGCITDGKGELVFCDACNRPWHPACAGIVQEPERNWYCWTCRTHIYTAWLPLREMTPDMSTLIICPGFGWTEKDARLSETTHVPADWFTAYPREWHRVKLSLTQMIVFSAETVHASTVHASDVPRYSLDFRFLVHGTLLPRGPE